MHRCRNFTYGGTGIGSMWLLWVFYYYYLLFFSLLIIIVHQLKICGGFKKKIYVHQVFVCDIFFKMSTLNDALTTHKKIPKKIPTESFSKSELSGRKRLLHYKKVLFWTLVGLSSSKCKWVTTTVNLSAIIMVHDYQLRTFLPFFFEMII